MRKIYFLILILLIADFLFQRCANPINPTGGPKDTIPPTLLESSPILGTTNFNDQTITLSFDEFINADKLQQNLVITPKTEIKYKHQIKRMQLILKFEESFKDSTTYSLNFFDGVTDITERNPVVNLSLAFSTGSYIDSMNVSGNVSDLFTKKPNNKFTVALYPITDTLVFLTDDPTYFTTTDEFGYFEINYIKSGRYKIISFFDENRNLLLDPETEAHGFLSDTLNLLNQDTSEYSIRTQLLNVKPIKYINSRPVAQYIEVKYSREISSYELFPDSVESIIIGDKKDVIRLYNKNQFTFNDSIQFVISASDSLNNNTTDTIKTVFLESNRKLPSFTSNILNKNNETIEENQKVKVKFNKPIDIIDSTKFSFKKDSTFYYPINPELNWNKNKDELVINTKINLDSVLSALDRSLPKDTIKLDSTAIDTNIPSTSLKPNLNFDFEMASGAFISVEADTSKASKLSFKTTKKESYGTLNINLTTEEPSFTLQLLSSEKVMYQSSNNKKINFPKVTPGSYKIRILIDDNNDGEWSHGNILKNEEPETVFLYPEETSVRENWVIDMDITF